MTDNIKIKSLKGTEITIKQNVAFCQMHSRVDYCYVLLEGELNYFLKDEVTEEETVLFGASKKGIVLGWEAIHSPERFITGIAVKSEKAVLLKIEKNAFLAQLTTPVLSELCHELHYLLETSFLKQTKLLSSRVKQRAVKLDNYFISQDSTQEEREHLLRSSPFFAEFLEKDITKLSLLLERREYEMNELIYDQKEHTGGLFVLIQGEVSIRRQEGDAYIDVRSISTPGYIFGWSSTFGDPDIFRAYTEGKTSVYFVSNEKLQLLIKDGSFGTRFHKMVIWLLNNQLQLSHSRYMYLLHDHNLVSVKHLIDINRPRLPVPSALHQIPHLLKDSTTQVLAFDTLHDLHDNGTREERHLSSICLDLLKGEEREMLFLNAIAEVYNTVSTGKNRSTDENRRLCAEKTKIVFDSVSFQLEGKENLPSEPGHIFIYNHLVNHQQYTLNNRFQLTLDSHFMSSLILNETYGDPGIRVVRQGKNVEYGHQDYYENLGYINVYTHDSEKQDDQSKINAKERFYEEAGEFLGYGKNIIISPEGTSFFTEESPGPFKMGPFNLATSVPKEPYLVPVVFCNFDKRITESYYYCRILKPFKISERKPDNQSLRDFVIAYQQEFAAEVENGRNKADQLLNELNR